MEKAEDKKMKAIDAIKERLRELYLSGKTDAQLAKMADCSTTHMNNLRNGKRDISGVSVDFLLKLFPDLDAPIVAVCRGKHGVTQVANGNSDCNINQTASDSSSDLASYQLRLYRGLAGLDISDDAKAKVLALIQSAGEAR